MDDALNILIGRLCLERLDHMSECVRDGDGNAIAEQLHRICRDVCDDMGQHPAPGWMEECRTPAAMIHAVCNAISEEFGRHMGNDEANPLLREAARVVVLRICLAMDDDEERQLDRTMRTMIRHAEAEREVAERLSRCPALDDLSIGLRSAVVKTVSEWLQDYAMLIMSDHRGTHTALWHLTAHAMQACPPSSLTLRDLQALGMDGRLDRRPADLVARLTERCMIAAAHAMEQTPPSDAITKATRLAAEALGPDQSLEMRFKARMIALGQTVDRSGK